MAASILAGRTILITGASRGIGRAMALRVAADGANVVIAAKSAEPHPKLPGTVYSVAEEVEAAGGRGLGVVCDVRFEDQIQAAVNAAVETFGGLDVVVNNAGAVMLASTAETPLKRFDLMQAVNVRAVFAMAQAALPHLTASSHAHILNISPPLNFKPEWMKSHLAYTLSKYGMTTCTLGMAEEFRAMGIAVNSLWPRTVVATAAIDMLFGPAGRSVSRTPEIMADAAHMILCTENQTMTGQTVLDEDLLRTTGMTDFSRYNTSPDQTHWQRDLFVDE